MPVPHLSTALHGPILDLENRIYNTKPLIEHWLRSKWREYSVPFYCSVDLRNSGFKLAPVDTNLFPGGFNNLNPEFIALCVQAVMTAVEKICPDAHSVLLIPENHTRNTFYLTTTCRTVFRKFCKIWIRQSCRHYMLVGQHAANRSILRHTIQ